MKKRRVSISSFSSSAPRSLFLPISLTQIRSLQVVTPLTRHFTSSLQLLISINGICLWVGTIAWRTRTGSLYTLSGQLQGGEMGCAVPIPRAHCCAKVPSDPETINIWKLRQSGYNLFWWLLPILLASTLWAWFAALPLSSWCKVSKFSLAGHFRNTSKLLLIVY